jgi:hypothetical protein
MATSNRVFVSPGVYTSEKDLTFVAQSIGVTTLGLVGETLKGPAFEPVLIKDFDEFRVYFGGTSTLKDGNGNPKYELGYVAKSYLQESNQLFVTRILGLTGYKPYRTYGLTTLGGLQSAETGATPTEAWENSFNTSTTGTTTPTYTGITGSTFYSTLSGKTSIDGTTITDYVVQNFSGYTTADHNKWFVIGLVPSSGTTSLNADLEQPSPLTSFLNDENTNGKEWYNEMFSADLTKVYSYLFIYNSGSTNFTTTRYTYDASVNTDYEDIVIASFRTRGRYVNESLVREVSGATSVNITEIDDIESNPLGEFTINVTGATGGGKSFTCSLDSASSKFITKVFGIDVFDRDYSDFPIYVHEQYSNLLNNLYDNGLIRGISTTVSTNTDGTDFVSSWTTSNSPYVVSEVRGNKVNDLFRFVTVSDGESSNYDVKMTIQNIDLEKSEFDVIVRDFNDTDENMVVLERFTRCSMDPNLPGYVAKKIGTSDGEFDLRSKYIMLEMAVNHPVDAVPSGFRGYPSNTEFGVNTLGTVTYKKSYLSAGDVIRYLPDGTPVVSNGDKVKKVSLGFSSQVGYRYDRDLLKFKGASATGVTHGFHLSTNASTLTGSTPTGFEFETTPYDLEGPNKGLLDSIAYRKFTLVTSGGFDGWDIYRNVRTFGDNYVFGKTSYVSNHSSNSATSGVFDDTSGNSDYYSYLQGIQTFANPEAVDINVFATPGINFSDHNSLTTQAIDMVESDRADSLYIISSKNRETALDVIDDLDTAALDSNYSATYWPWIQIRDQDSSNLIYLPPTCEVVRNIALTDNVSYPWFAVAGYQRGLVNSVKAFKKLTLDERDDLYLNRINPIATFSDTGTIIWGNKTLQVRESALDRINVRRLLLRARKLISAVAVRLLFEQNDEQVRNEFLRLVNPILEAIKKERGLTDFRVSVSNDPEDIDANTLRGKIYIKPTRSLEYIDVEFIITPTGASFENI